MDWKKIAMLIAEETNKDDLVTVGRLLERIKEEDIGIYRELLRDGYPGNAYPLLTQIKAKYNLYLQELSAIYVCSPKQLRIDANLRKFVNAF